jgi:hypothetical protein
MYTNPNPSLDSKIARFVAPCPTCAHLLIERLFALRQLSGTAVNDYMDTNGCWCPNPMSETLEARIETIAATCDIARLYRAVNRDSGWPHFGEGHNTWREPAVDPQEFCSVYLPGPLDTPLTIPERDRANVIRAMCHASRVRHFLNGLGVTYAA